MRYGVGGDVTYSDPCFVVGETAFFCFCAWQSIYRISDIPYNMTIYEYAEKEKGNMATAIISESVTYAKIPSLNETIEEKKRCKPSPINDYKTIIQNQKIDSINTFDILQLLYHRHKITKYEYKKAIRQQKNSMPISNTIKSHIDFFLKSHKSHIGKNSQYVRNAIGKGQNTYISTEIQNQNYSIRLKKSPYRRYMRLFEPDIFGGNNADLIALNCAKIEKNTQKEAQKHIQNHIQNMPFFDEKRHINIKPIKRLREQKYMINTKPYFLH